MNQTLTTGLESDISRALGFLQMSEKEKSTFLEKIGALAIESALLRFVVTLEPTERASFESWLSLRAQDETLFDQVVALHPAFAELLDEEITAMHEAMGRMM